MIYVTMLDQFHPGIYSSQVIDVCDHLRKRSGKRVRIVAFLSIRELMRSDAAKQLKKLSPGAIVVPAVPGLENYWMNAVTLFLICLFTGNRVAVCRHPFATQVALSLRRVGVLRRVIYDGRSAISAECEEYDVFPVPFIRSRIRQIESKAVLRADHRMAVSNALVDYWRERFGYTAAEHTVIPCTLDSRYFPADSDAHIRKRQASRERLGFAATDTVLIYAGSTAPWQSFDLLSAFLSPLLKASTSVKVLFLSRETTEIASLIAQFPAQVICRWVSHADIRDHLSAGDYGLLLREMSVTNKVASPVKFAEYLYSGLRVLISGQLGDFSDFVIRHDCGSVVRTGEVPVLEPSSDEQALSCHRVAEKYFQKESAVNAAGYDRVLAALAG